MLRVLLADSEKKIYHIYMYGVVGSWKINAENFIEEIKAIPEDTQEIRIFINSPGGYTDQGYAIIANINRLSERFTINTFVDGIAGSMASIIAVMGTTVTIQEGADFYLHNVQFQGSIDAEDFDRIADSVKEANKVAVNAYMAKTSQDEETVRGWMKAPGTYFSAAQAKEVGLADVVVPAVKIAALADVKEGFSEEERKQLFKSTTTKPNGDEIMDRKLLCKQLGLEENATDDQINRKVQSMNTVISTLEEQKEDLEKKLSKKDETITSLQEKVQKQEVNEVIDKVLEKLDGKTISDNVRKELVTRAERYLQEEDEKFKQIFMEDMQNYAEKHSVATSMNGSQGLSDEDFRPDTGGADAKQLIEDAFKAGELEAKSLSTSADKVKNFYN